MNRLVFLLVLCAFATAVTAQQPNRLAFDVASIKVSKSGLPGPVWAGTGPGRLVVDGITGANLIRNAYELRPDEIVGTPAWLDADRFQINATYPPESGTPKYNAMLRSLLEDRFGLRAHRERRAVPKYRLVLVNPDGPLGPQIEKTTSQCAYPHPDRPCSMRA